MEIITNILISANRTFADSLRIINTELNVYNNPENFYWDH
jgi:hypothetical protein